ncbi:MAG TPA: hypothetical protein VEZ52_06990 [Desulfovibrio sp.]|nr:hypothetical protein [Desulfovibrio sp.]
MDNKQIIRVKSQRDVDIYSSGQTTVAYKKVLLMVSVYFTANTGGLSFYCQQMELAWRVFFNGAKGFLDYCGAFASASRVLRFLPGGAVRGLMRRSC